MPITIWGQMTPDTAKPKYEIPAVKYPTAEAFVITYNIMDFRGADNTGRTDMAPLIKTLLKKMVGSDAKSGGVGNGGILFLPEGKYLLNSNIVVPKGVTIRGEWQKPERGKPITGTIIVSDFGRGEETPEKSLFILEPAAAVKDLAFWYPKQNPENIVPYPPTIGYGAPRYWGNDFCVAKNVTFVNAYSGAVLLGDGGAPNMFGLYGTPLKQGIEIDYISEVGRVEGADFSPDYWIGSGLPGSPKNAAAFKTWLKNNGTGAVLRRIDWTIVTDLTVDGYCIGVHLAASKKQGAPNGFNYLLRFTDCRTAVYAESFSTNAGMLFHDVRISDCDYGLFVPKRGTGILQASRWEIAATKYAFAIDQDAAVRISMNQSRVFSGKIELLGGVAAILDSDINTDKPQVQIGQESRVIMAGNRFSKGVDIRNHSMYESQISHDRLLNYKKIPDFPYKLPETMVQRPERNVLYIATEHGVKPNDNSIDNTQALQTLLNRAGSEGGGIVYLPVGKYRILGHLTVPTGVELHGAVDVGSVPLGPGSALEAYEGKGNTDAPPLLTMQERSGLRGIVINYPEQKFNELLKGTGDAAILEPHVYPYAVRVAGKGVWLVNVGFRATYGGIDMFTHRCDDVYVEYPAGHFFSNGIRIGGKTENVRINNAQFNTIGYSHGNQSKFGCWANARSDDQDSLPAYRQNYRDLRFFILEDCKNVWLFNNFHFGSNIGTVVGSETAGPSGLVLGHGVDAAVKALYFRNVGAGGFDLIGSQIVALRHNVPGGGDAARFLETDERFRGTANVFLMTCWGNPFHAVEIKGGNLNIQSANIRGPGSERFLEAKGGRLRFWGSLLNNPAKRAIVNEGAERFVSVTHSLVDVGPAAPEKIDLFTTNLSTAPQLDSTAVLDRTGWTATTSRGSGANNMLDGNPDTRWGTGGVMQKGDWLVVDMQKPQRFNTILLNQGTSGGDFPQKFEASISNDGQHWGTPVMTGEGSQDVTFVRFPSEITTRYVKIVLTEPRDQTRFWWTVAEFSAVSRKDESLTPPDTPTLWKSGR